MNLDRLKSFAAVARLGSITHAARELHLSQPAISAHIKTLEGTLGIALFERNARGMELTPGGAALLVKARDALHSHAELLAEAARLRGQLTGRLRLGVGANSSKESVASIVAGFSERCPEVEISLEELDSHRVVDGILHGHLDAGFYNASNAAQEGLQSVAVTDFGLHLTAAPSFFDAPPSWPKLAAVPWICAPPDTCCGRATTRLFEEQRIQPENIIQVDSEGVTRTLIAAGVGVGLLHTYTAEEAEARGEVALISKLRLPSPVSVRFAFRRQRESDPMVVMACSILRDIRNGAPH